MKLSLTELDARVRAVLDRAGLSRDHVQAVSAVIVAAERDGAKSHGVYRLEGCLKTVAAGKVSPTAEPVLTDNGSAILRASAQGGFSCAVVARAVPLLAQRASRLGLAALAVNDAAHFSALWYEVELLTELGVAAVAMCPSYSVVAPAGGRHPLFGTNPFAFGWPRGGDQPYVFDFATSQIARGEIELRRRAGERLPEGWALNREGEPTTDPDEALAGAMLPFGGHKGSALSTMIELLGGALIGDAMSQAAKAAVGDTMLTPTHGELIVAFDPARFSAGRPNDPNTEAEALFDAIEAQGARLPSQRRFAARRHAELDGVELSQAEIDMLHSMAEYGLAALD